jgi:RNA polymerase sigma factor (sigma-70 family)
MTPEQTALFEEHQDLAARAAHGFPIPGEDVESVRQEALMGLQKAVDAYNPDKGRFEPFAQRVIKNRLYSTYRNTRHRQIELTILDGDVDEHAGDSGKDRIADREPTPAHETERNEIRDALKQGLAALTPSQREVLENYAEGGSFAEVARQTGISEQAVRQMFQRGVRQMRPHVESLGVCGARFLPDCPKPHLEAWAPRPRIRTPTSSRALGIFVVLVLLGLVLFCLAHVLGTRLGILR